ncbi:MAG TPA: hypothetical protein VI756_21960 [Blastocatellia bacterium]
MSAIAANARNVPGRNEQFHPSSRTYLSNVANLQADIAERWIEIEAETVYLEPESFA